MKPLTWVCENMNVCVQGLQHLTIQTDHKPHIRILSNKSLRDM